METRLDSVYHCVREFEGLSDTKAASAPCCRFLWWISSSVMLKIYPSMYPFDCREEFRRTNRWTYFKQWCHTVHLQSQCTITKYCGSNVSLGQDTWFPHLISHLGCCRANTSALQWGSRISVDLYLNWVISKGFHWSSLAKSLSMLLSSPTAKTLTLYQLQGSFCVIMSSDISNMLLSFWEPCSVSAGAFKFSCWHLDQSHPFRVVDIEAV